LQSTNELNIIFSAGMSLKPGVLLWLPQPDNISTERGMAINDSL